MFGSNSESPEMQLCRARISIAQRDLYIQQSNELVEDLRQTINRIGDARGEADESITRIKEENANLVAAIEKKEKQNTNLRNLVKELKAQLTRLQGQGSFVVVDDINNWDPVKVMEEINEQGG